MAKKTNTIKVETPASISKKYGGGLVSQMDEVRFWIPSRVLSINHLFGGGIPYGGIVELFGTESGGKTLLAMDFGYGAQECGGIVIWGDGEKSFTKRWAEQIGLDHSKIWLNKENTVEILSDWIKDSCVYWRSILVNNEPILVVIDSLAVLECMEAQNASQVDAKADFGNRAKAISKMLRARQPLWDDLGVGVILINQLREKQGASKFEDPDTTPGGQATKFYACIRAGLYGGKQILKKIKGRETRVGRLTSVRIKKNKVAPPRKSIKGLEVYTDPDYTKMPLGFSKYFGLDELIEKFEVFKKKGSRFYYKGKMIANGKDALMEVLKNDDSLRRKVIRKCEINTIGSLQTQLENQTKNWYPVKATKTKDKDEEKDEE
jgi:recombination protein RecA